MEPDNDHGDQRHITAQQLRDAAEASGSDVQAVRANIDETTRRIQAGELQTSASGYSR